MNTLSNLTSKIATGWLNFKMHYFRQNELKILLKNGIMPQTFQQQQHCAPYIASLLKTALAQKPVDAKTIYNLKEAWNNEEHHSSLAYRPICRNYKQRYEEINNQYESTINPEFIIQPPPTEATVKSTTDSISGSHTTSPSVGQGYPQDETKKPTP